QLITSSTWDGWPENCTPKPGWAGQRRNPMLSSTRSWRRLPSRSSRVSTPFRDASSRVRNSGLMTSVITTEQALGALAGRLRAESRLAFDTEAASFHKYVDRVYLIQISSPKETVIVDPLAVRDLTPLGDLLADPAIEVVFHDADYDLRSLDRDYGFKARNIFDTRIAAQLLGEPGVGLG